MRKWKMVKLGEVTRIQSGYSFKSDEFLKDGVPIIRIGNLNGKSVIVDDNICYYKKFWDEHSEFRIYYGDILIAMSGATVGKIGIYKQNKPSLLNQRVAKIMPQSDKLNNKYLYNYVKSELFMTQIRATAFGCAQPNISGKQIAEIKIPLPPLEEQKRIADILDKVSSLIDLRKQQLEKMDLLIKSKFIDMFGDPITNPKGWEVKEWADLLTIKNGKNQSKVENLNGKYPIYGSGGIISYSDQYLCKENSIIIGRKGNINKPIFVKEKFWNVDTAFALEVRENVLAPLFLLYFCEKYNFEQLNRTVTIPSLTKSDLLKIKMSVPTISIQTQFAGFVEQVEKQKAVMQQSLKKMETNYKALMQEYFG